MKMQTSSTKQLFAAARQKLDTQRMRYLLAGGWNTFFGYTASIVIYSLLSNRLHVVEIAVLGNIIAITMAFLTYKLFVFQTKGNWLREYFRSYLVYGGMALVGIGLLWIMVDGLHIPFWQAQGLVILLTVVISYFGHSRFTFRKPG
jgi:putative flippase GtrA